MSKCVAIKTKTKELENNQMAIPSSQIILHNLLKRKKCYQRQNRLAYLKNVTESVTFSHFYPSLIFVGKVSSSLACKYQTWANGRARFKNVNNCLYTNIYSYLETSGGISYNLYLNAVHFSTPELIRHLWQHKTIVILHQYLICSVLIQTLDLCKNDQKTFVEFLSSRG